MAGKFLVVAFSLLWRIGAAQLACDLRNTLANSFTPIDVSLAETSCFECPETATSFTLDNSIAANQRITSGSGVVIDGSTLTISDWSAYDISMTESNKLSCETRSGSTFRTVFFTLTPGPLTLHPMPLPPLFFENSSSNISILCINNNRRPGYNEQVQVWTDSTGAVVGHGQTLVLPQVRASAGTYTCNISTIPIIPAVTYEVVIYFSPEITTDANLPTQINVGEMLILECAFVGVPEINITWTLNSSELNSSVNSNISIIIMSTGSSKTTTLTWNNVPASAQGTYNCVLENVIGSAFGSYSIKVTAGDEGDNIIGTNRLSAVYSFSGCPSAKNKEIITENVISFLSSKFGVSHVGLTKSSAASSCEQALHAHPSGQGFLYWIINGNATKQQYCY